MFAMQATRIHRQIREPTKIVVNGRKEFRYKMFLVCFFTWIKLRSFGK